MSPWFLLLLPLAAAGLNGLVLRRAGFVAAAVSVAAVLGTLFITWQLLTKGPGEVADFTWIRLPGFEVKMGLKLDDLSIGMMFVVTFIGALVHVFSLGYMAGDEAKGRYFAGLSLFMFSMTGIVLADNFVMMFIFWELVGVSSFLLIGHYDHKNSAGEASKKAFLTNRIGDFGFMIGILMVWGLTGSVMFDVVEKSVEGMSPALGGALTAATLLVFCGAVGKSAQLPLHVWLPDAMEGPTPVSALIHAATMVAAGVYMLARVQFLVAGTAAGDVIAWVGGVTAAFAALVALQQNDIKRVLAYSTLSQLGYMVMAIGIHAFDEAMFHLYTHAFFKALLFLGAGSVIHACHHEQDIWKMGGLAGRMVVTFATFAIGTLALIAVPFTSGYASKELILEAAYEDHRYLFWVAAAVAFLTPFYMTRLLLVAFLGKGRSDAVRGAKENSFVMLIPLVLLALFAAVSDRAFIAEAVRAVVPHHDAVVEGAHGKSPVKLISWVALALGVFLAGLLYWGRERDPIRIPFLERKFYLDEIYGVIVRVFQDFTGHLLYAMDQLLIGAASVTGSAKAVEGAGRLMRRLQTGNLQSYAFLMAAGSIVVLLIIFIQLGGN